MLSTIIQTKLDSLASDTSSVALLFFMVILVIYFFAILKPAIDSKRRINRMANRRYERYLADNIYKSKVNAVTKSSSSTMQKTVVNQAKKPYRKNNGYYKKDKGYQAYLRRNSKFHDNKQSIKHDRFKTFSSKKVSNTSGNGLRPNQGRFGVKFIGNLPLNRLPENPRHTGPTNSFRY